jgi:hypothetical protein
MERKIWDREMIVCCTRCRNDMEIEHGSKDWICEQCKIYLADQLSTNILWGIIKQRKSKNERNNIWKKL